MFLTEPVCMGISIRDQQQTDPTGTPLSGYVLGYHSRHGNHGLPYYVAYYVAIACNQVFLR
jgi:hypothetical protein